MQEGVMVPGHEVAPLDNIAAGLTGLRILLVNVYAATNPDGSWTLIDAGLPFSATRIRRWAEEKFGNTPPRAIVLTHAHFDHVGALRSLAEYWDVPVYAHRLEMPYLTSRSKYPPPNAAAGGGLLALMAPLYPRGPVDIGGYARELPRDGSVPGLEGWRWIPTPGHTPGHVSLFRDSDRVLIAGDAVVTTKQESMLAVATQRPELHGPPAYYTQDWEAAKLSVGRLAGLSPSVVAAGHGLPMSGVEVMEALRYLATNLDRIARPAVRERSLLPKVVIIGTAAAGLVYGLVRWRRAA